VQKHSHLNELFIISSTDFKKTTNFRFSITCNETGFRSFIVVWRFCRSHHFQQSLCYCHRLLFLSILSSPSVVLTVSFSGLLIDTFITTFRVS